MKKLLFTLLLVLPAISFSQSLAIKAGLVSSTMDNPNMVGESRLNSPVLGLVYIHETQRFRIFVEPSFVAKGFSSNITITDANGFAARNEKLNYKWNYIELPVLLGYNIIDSDLFWGVNLGVSPNFLLNAKAKSASIDMKINNNNPVVLDIIGGTYLGYKLSDNFSTILNLRGGRGLIDPNKNVSAAYVYFSPFINLAYKF